MTQLPPDTTLRFQERPGYLLAEVQGPCDSFEISLAYWTAVAAECRQRGSRNLLVHERLGDYVGERDMPRLVAAIIALGFNEVRVAFVDDSIEQLAQLEHGAILANEQGIEGRVFASLQQADWWLRHGSGDS